jgi:hypothetical protein
MISEFFDGHSELYNVLGNNILSFLFMSERIYHFETFVFKFFMWKKAIKTKQNKMILNVDNLYFTKSV